MFYLLTYFLFSLFLLALNGESHKILVYNPRLGRSQLIFMEGIADILTKAGNDVLNYVPTIQNTTKGTGSTLSRVLLRNATHKTTFQVGDVKRSWLFDHQSYMGAIEVFSTLGKEFELSCREQLADKDLIRKLRDEKFDIGLTECFDICGLGLFHKIGLKKWILVYSTPMPLADMSLFGLSATPSFTPASMSSYTERMSIKERFFNLLSYFIYKYKIRSDFLGQTAEAFDSNTPHYLDLISQSEYVFVNDDEYLNFPMATSPKIRKTIDVSLNLKNNNSSFLVSIGGIGMQKLEHSKRELEPKIKTAFDTAKKGVVFVSFGSVAKSHLMPKETKKAFLQAFDAFPEINFIWKYEKPEHNISAGHPNVLTEEWVDQTTILNHPKLLAFITHGGLNSVTQASYAGVALIVIPLFADQPRNGAMVESRGFGIRLNKFKLNAQTIIDAIKEVVYNEKYSKNAKRLSRIIKSKPLSPDERIVKYTEHAAQFDINPYLDFYGRQLSSVEYYNLDIAFLFLLFLALIVYAVKLLFNRLLLTQCLNVFSKSKNYEILRKIN